MNDDREQLLAAAFVELADNLVDDYDVINVLDRLAAHSVALLAAEAAGIMLVDASGQLQVVAASNAEPDLLDLLQVQTDEGPCVECVRSGEMVAITDVGVVAARWPGLSAMLAEHGGTYRSVHALPLRRRGETIGGLNLFHTRPGPLPETDLRLGQALADIVTIGILQERASRHAELALEQLQDALDSRVVVEQAKGILAHAGGLTMDVAFARLRRHARSHNLLLVEVARRVVAEPGFARQILRVEIT